VAKYLLIESRDPFSDGEVGNFFELAGGLVKDGNEVTLFLVQNGVLPARKSTKSQLLTDLSKAGVQVLADDFSLRERGITTDRIATGVQSAKLDVVVDQLAEGRKAMWH
jgi:sulfur relay (sulfurtransferase) complex TusBCD TusD component (DsrE family)